jgi:hypothetical protein
MILKAFGILLALVVFNVCLGSILRDLSNGSIPVLIAHWTWCLWSGWTVGGLVARRVIERSSR